MPWSDTVQQCGHGSPIPTGIVEHLGKTFNC